MTSNGNDCECGDQLIKRLLGGIGSLQFSPLIKRKSIFCLLLPPWVVVDPMLTSEC